LVHAQQPGTDSPFTSSGTPTAGTKPTARISTTAKPPVVQGVVPSPSLAAKPHAATAKRVSRNITHRQTHVVRHLSHPASSATAKSSGPSHLSSQRPSSLGAPAPLFAALWPASNASVPGHLSTGAPIVPMWKSATEERTANAPTKQQDTRPARAQPQKGGNTAALVGHNRSDSNTSSLRSNAAGRSPARPGANNRSTGTASAAKSAAAVASTKPSDTLLVQTKPDTLLPADTSQDHPLDSPLQVVGEGWKMIAYLIPTLIFILVCLNLLRRYQQKNGRMPGVIQAAARTATLSAPLHGSGAWSSLFGRNRTGRNQDGGTAAIRLLESISVGTATLHLVQVRGRVLLLAGTGATVTVLTEFEEAEGIESDQFRALLQAAAADMDPSELTESAVPVSAVVGSLENDIRKTGDAMARRLRRLRTVQEAEDGGL
jgi:flagellar biogenesis protein FliO